MIKERMQKERISWEDCNLILCFSNFDFNFHSFTLQIINKLLINSFLESKKYLYLLNFRN